MIPRTPRICQTETAQTREPLGDWQTQLGAAIRDPAELLRYLELPGSLLAGAKAASDTFALRVPLSYLEKIKKGDINDPLLRQILPLDAEMLSDPHFSQDPVGDIAAMAVPGVLHKYHGRVLLITTPACGIHCRYCFRRHFPYQENRPEQNWQAAMDYIRKNPDIHEVILSGGDPLSLNEVRLTQLSNQLRDIPHIQTLRIHTRQAVVLPERINDKFLDWIDSLPWKIVMVLHVNHANEIDDVVASHLQLLQQHHVTLLNQSVLLAGVNDNHEALVSLSQQLFRHHVLPYYLHLLDKVQGAKHFYVEKNKAVELVSQMQKMLPGYLVPRLVQEIPGETSKTAVSGAI